MHMLSNRFFNKMNKMQKPPLFPKKYKEKGVYYL